MNARLQTLRWPAAYGLLAAAIVWLLAADFVAARRREPAHDRYTLPLVSRERALARFEPAELRQRGPLAMTVRGLSLIEMVPEDHRVWRQGLAPATVVTVAPRDGGARLLYAFDNALPGQVLTIRMDARVVATRGPLPVARISGVVGVPASPDPIDIAFEFSRWAQTPPDSRKITVTFRELSLAPP